MAAGKAGCCAVAAPERPLATILLSKEMNHDKDFQVFLQRIKGFNFGAKGGRDSSSSL
jgi:hypothetical protein